MPLVRPVPGPAEEELRVLFAELVLMRPPLELDPSWLLRWLSVEVLREAVVLPCGVQRGPEAAVPQGPIVMPSKGSPPSRGELEF